MGCLAHVILGLAQGPNPSFFLFGGGTFIQIGGLLGNLDLDLDQGLTIIIKVILHMFFNEFGLIPNSNLPTLRKFLETDIDFGKT